MHRPDPATAGSTCSTGIGEKRWELDTGAGLTASPAVAAGKVVIGAQDGRLDVFE